MLKLGRYWPWITVPSHFHMTVQPMLLHHMAVRQFCKNLGNLQEFLGQMVYPPPRPGKKLPVGLCTEYLLIISAKPELKLGEHLVDGRIVNASTVVSLRQRRNSTLVESVCETALGLHLCTRIWVRVMIGLLRKPLSICNHDERKFNTNFG